MDDPKSGPQATGHFGYVPTTILSGRLRSAGIARPRPIGVHDCPQYPQDESCRRALQTLREAREGPDGRHRDDRANVYLSRRDRHQKTSWRTVIHRLLRCPAHTKGGVVVRPPFSAFDDLSTEDSTSVDNLNGDSR
jgi:hypothetical protein